MNDDYQRIEAYLQSILTSVSDMQRRMAQLKAAKVDAPEGLVESLQQNDSDLGDTRDLAYGAY